MWSRPQYTDLTYMRGTRPCAPMTITFSSVIQSYYISQTIKFSVNRTFHVLKTPVYRFDLYGRYRTLWTDDYNFWQCYLSLVYKPKYQLWCESDVPSKHQFTDLTNMGGNRFCRPIQPIFNANQRMGNRSLCANFQVCCSLCSDAIVFNTEGQTDIAQMSQNFALIKCLQGTQGPRSLFLGVRNVLTKLIYPL